MLEKRNLIFPKNIPPYFDGFNVKFWGQDGDKKISCAIIFEALEDNNPKHENDYLKIFSTHIVAIENMARRKYYANQLELDGSILITTLN